MGLTGDRDGDAMTRRLDTLLTLLLHGHAGGDLPLRYARKLC
jgi:hypothetical protein